MTKFIFVVGGVMSGIGKGITVASTARILKDYGFKVTAVKIDPYLNVDAGTMNPIEHGEVFVTDDGLETDQDIGNYERFADENIPRENYMTTGLVYQSVINRERNLDYGGKCVQIIPHVTDEIESRLMRAAKKSKADFVLVEIGGTVGEYENLLFLETGRIMKLKMPGHVLFILVSYFPVPKMTGEMKTKPTQHAVRSLNSAGIQPDIIIARSEVSLDQARKTKVSIFCNMRPQDIISAPDISSIYEVPVNFEKDDLGQRIMEKLNLKSWEKDSRLWSAFVKKIKSSRKAVKIGIIGKYFDSGKFTLADSYISVIEAVKHASWSLNYQPEIVWLNAESYEKDPAKFEELKNFDGIVVPGGFGKRGVEGKILAIKYARENNLPFLGLCYGLQLAVIEFARHVCDLKEAHTTEVKPATPHPVICTMADQIGKIKNKEMGGTMRLGAYPCLLTKGTKAYAAYKKELIYERHRHRFEVNNKFRKKLNDNGMIFSGVAPDNSLVEIIELPGHPWFVAGQFHPELKSRAINPHPLFRDFVKAAKDYRESHHD